MKNAITSFLPWILYFLVKSSCPVQTGAAILLAGLTTILFDFNSLKRGFILSWGSLLFFSFMFVGITIFDNEWIFQHNSILSNACLAGISWLSILIRKPFTIQYARLQVSEDKWQHPLFLRINYILSGVWGMIFLFSCAVHVLTLYSSNISPWIDELIVNTAAILGILFTVKFPNWYRESRHAKVG